MKVRELFKSDELKIFVPDTSKEMKIPFWESMIPAGFPSPAEDYLEMQLDLNEHLISNPSSTFFAQIIGTSMINSGIHHNDIVIVDRSVEPKNDSILVCSIDGEFTLKRFRKSTEKTAFLVPDNPEYEPIKVESHNELQVWGVVTYSIHKHY